MNLHAQYGGLKMAPVRVYMDGMGSEQCPFEPVKSLKWSKVRDQSTAQFLA